MPISYMRKRKVVAFAFFMAGIAIIVVMAVFAPQFFRLDSPAAVAATNSNTAQVASDETYFLARIFQDSGDGSPSTFVSTIEIIQRLFMAVLLSGILAFRPRKNTPLFGRSLFVSQTQILLAVVAAALMMIVGDNAARAFAIFAAVSLVRFRTNIRDPKEITVLLISMALGLASGIGRWDLGIALCLFALALLWVLELREYEQTFRSMELCVKSRDPEKTQNVLKKIFKRLDIDAEVRELIPPEDKKDIGSIAYYLNLKLSLTTDRLSDRILAADPKNIEGIEWSKSKSAGDIYQ